NKYNAFMDAFLCGEGDAPFVGDQRRKASQISRRLRLPFPDTDAYRQLKVATEVFLMSQCGVAFDRPDFGRKLPAFSSELGAEQRRYYDPTLQAGGISNLWNQLLSQQVLNDKVKDSPVRTLPYFAIIRRKLKDVPI